MGQGPRAQWGRLRTAVVSQDGKPHHCLGISCQEPHWPGSVLYPAPAGRPQEFIFNIKTALEMFVKKNIDLWHKSCWPHPPWNLKIRKNCLFSSQTLPSSTSQGNKQHLHQLISPIISLNLASAHSPLHQAFFWTTNQVSHHARDTSY